MLVSIEWLYSRRLACLPFFRRAPVLLKVRLALVAEVRMRRAASEQQQSAAGVLRVAIDV